MSATETFEKHGQVWTSHRPGDRCPCPDGTKIYVVSRQNVASPTMMEGSTFPAEVWEWGKRYGDDQDHEIIGWRFAEPASPPVEENDELLTSIQKLTGQPGICLESIALIEAALSVQAGKTSFADALSLLAPAKGNEA